MSFERWARSISMLLHALLCLDNGLRGVLIVLALPRRLVRPSAMASTGDDATELADETLPNKRWVDS